MKIRYGPVVVQAFVKAMARRSGPLCEDKIPRKRLTRAGKGTTVCRTRKREGRIAVSVTDLRRSQRLAKEALCKPWWNVAVGWMFIRLR
jgi:hypothetical protein